MRSTCSIDLESRASSSTCRLPTLATWSALWVVFVLKAGPSWVKLKICEWKRPRGFTVRVLSIKQTNKQTNALASKHLNTISTGSDETPASKHQTKQKQNKASISKQTNKQTPECRPKASKHPNVLPSESTSQCRMA